MTTISSPAAAKFLRVLPPPGTPLPEPYVYLSAAQGPVIERREGAEGLLPYVALLPGWVPHREVGAALGFGTDAIDAAEERFGPYVWASEFENVHSTWHFVEPPFAYRGVTFRGSEQLFQLCKCDDDALTPEAVVRFMCPEGTDPHHRSRYYKRSLTAFDRRDPSALPAARPEATFMT